MSDFIDKMLDLMRKRAARFRAGEPRPGELYSKEEYERKPNLLPEASDYEALDLLAKHQEEMRRG